jgi:hypothetical protein
MVLAQTTKLANSQPGEAHILDRYVAVLEEDTG